MIPEHPEPESGNEEVAVPKDPIRILEIESSKPVPQLDLNFSPDFENLTPEEFIKEQSTDATLNRIRGKLKSRPSITAARRTYFYMEGKVIYRRFQFREPIEGEPKRLLNS